MLTHHDRLVSESAANISVALLGMDSAIDALLPGVCRRGWPITGLVPRPQSVNFKTLI